MDKLTRWPVVALLLCAVTAVGCYPAKGRMVALSDDIPLVPLPPPPFGRTEIPPAPPLAKDPPAKPAPVPPAPLPEVTTPKVTTPTAEPPATKAAEPAAGAPSVRQLLQAAQARMEGVDSYIVRLTRREVIKETCNPEELMLVKFRKKPWGVYFKWLGKEGKGREVVYVKGRHEDKIHSLLAAGDIPLMPAGKRMSLAPDSFLVRSACRHPISEAGIGAAVERIGALVASAEAGDRRVGTLEALPPGPRPEFDRPVAGIEHKIPPGHDQSLPRGGRRIWYFHPEERLPMLVLAFDEKGREVEYYSYDRLQAGVKLDDHDFDPEHLWTKPAGAATASAK